MNLRLVYCSLGLVYLAAETTSSAAIRLYTDANRLTNGLVGSYVNQSLRSYAPPDDWRVTQTISGQRVNAVIDFDTSTWGSRASVGVTGGSDADWDTFSVQWDGYIEVLDNLTGVTTQSDDGSRMWIDLNNDGEFASDDREFLNNGWGYGQTVTTGPLSFSLRTGFYRIRIQYDAGIGDSIMSLLVNPGPIIKPAPTVRVAYLIPSNRTPQTNAVFKLQRVMLMCQQWYREQMERNGFGPKTFLLESDPRGVTPMIHLVNVAETDDYLRGDIWTRSLNAASAAGVPIWTPRQAWLLVVEAHLEMPDGSITGGVALGAGSGSGDDPGVGLLGSDGLARFDPTFLTDNRTYDGLILPEVGPYSLRQSVSFPWFEGDTVSSVSSSIMGAALHEFSHGFGLAHIFRNDENFHGNLMGNGLRGIRGNFFPNLYPNDDTRLSFASALSLNVSRYFNANSNFTDDSKPTVNISTSGSVALTNGQVRIAFTASGASPLSAALLRLVGDVIEAMPLSGTSVNAAFMTPFFTPGQVSDYTVSVIDAQGNRQNVDTYITPESGVDRAPKPYIKITPPTPFVGQPVTFSASQTTDPDDSASLLQVEWDLDGDGVFDTGATTTKSFTTNFATAGTRLIRARVTDPAGAQALSHPVALRVIHDDATVPALVVNSPISPSYTTNASATAGGTVSDDSGVLWVMVNGQFVATSNGFTNWTTILSPLSVGTNAITVVATDKAAPPNSVTNLLQIIYATGSFDGDGDGIPDAWELQYFGSVNAPNGGPNMDPDGDGLTNVQEYLAGTDPTNASSALRLEPALRVGAELRLRFETVAGKSYRVEYKTGLGASSWSTLADNVAGTGSVLQITDTVSMGPGLQVYRVRLLP